MGLEKGFIKTCTFKKEHPILIILMAISSVKPIKEKFLLYDGKIVRGY
jgi:hypothetical protein